MSGYSQLGTDDTSHDHGHEHSSGHDHGHAVKEEVSKGHDHSHDHKKEEKVAAPAGHHDHDHDHKEGEKHDVHHGIEAAGHSKEEEEHIARKPLYIAMGLCFIFMLIELAGGIVGHSLAIITDALHMLTDVFSFALAIYASIIANQASTKNFTFGFKRAEVLSALVSTLLIWVLTAVLMYEAVMRIMDYNAGVMEDVNGKLMFFIAILGVGFNLVLERVLGGSGHGHSHGGHSHGHSAHAEEPVSTSSPLVKHAGHDHAGHDHAGHDHGGHDHGAVELEGGYGSTTDTDVPPPAPRRNLNIDAAYLHVIGDLIQSVGVAVAGLLIWHDSTWKIADPLCTIGFGVLVMITTLSMLWSNVTVLLEGVPDDIDILHIENQFLAIKDDKPNGKPLVTSVHDLHIWSMSTGSHILTAHVAHTVGASSPEVLSKVHAVCLKNGIAHATIQALPDDMPCTSGICCN